MTAPTITKHDLEGIACSNGMKRFIRMFGKKGAPITEAHIRKALKADMNPGQLLASYRNPRSEAYNRDATKVEDAASKAEDKVSEWEDRQREALEDWVRKQQDKINDLQDKLYQAEQDKGAAITKESERRYAAVEDKRQEKMIPIYLKHLLRYVKIRDENA
jgi:hypothetical protein